MGSPDPETGRRTYSLYAVCQALDIPLNRAHRTLPDAEATEQVLLRLYPRVETRGLSVLMRQVPRAPASAPERRAYYPGPTVRPLERYNSLPSAQRGGCAQRVLMAALLLIGLVVLLRMCGSGTEAFPATLPDRPAASALAGNPPPSASLARSGDPSPQPRRRLPGWTQPCSRSLVTSIRASSTQASGGVSPRHAPLPLLPGRASPAQSSVRFRLFCRRDQPLHHRRGGS